MCFSNFSAVGVDDCLGLFGGGTMLQGQPSDGLAQGRPLGLGEPLKVWRSPWTWPLGAPGSFGVCRDFCNRLVRFVTGPFAEAGESFIHSPGLRGAGLRLLSSLA